MTNGPMHFRPTPGQTLDRRNLQTLSGDDCGVSRRSSPAAHARARGRYVDTYVVAVNLVVVESDGSRPDRPDYHFSADIVDRSIKMMGDHLAADPKKPFFLYLAFNAPHAPMQATEDDLKKFDSI